MEKFTLQAGHGFGGLLVKKHFCGTRDYQHKGSGWRNSSEILPWLTKKGFGIPGTVTGAYKRSGTSPRTSETVIGRLFWEAGLASALKTKFIKMIPMNGEARKLHLIEAILKMEDESILHAIENIVLNGEAKPVKRKSLGEFAGTLTDEEAEEWLKNIEEGCEQINPNDWK